MDFKPVRERRRNNVRTLNSVTTLTQNGVVTSTTPATLSLVDSGYILDRNNPIELLQRGLADGLDIGGPLLSIQATNDFPVGSTYIGSGPVFGSNSWDLNGPIVAYPSHANTSATDLKTVTGLANYGGLALDSTLVRFGLGTTAISRCKPADPSASFGVFLAETYREGIPRLLSNFRVAGEIDYFRSLGSNYLNVEFGWKPFVADLKKTARSLDNSQKILEDLRRNSGKRMRRRYEFPTQTYSQLFITDNVRPWPNMNSYMLSQTKRTITISGSKRTWFDGEFIYRFPAVNDPYPSRIKAGLRQILGLDLTPETIWNIAPWTWLTDWYANTGDLLANVSAISEDDLTMRYGYLMQEVVRKDEHTHHGLSVPRGSMPSVLTGTTYRKVKTRLAASPYGFGVKWSDLSLRQTAILAALGITRTGRYQD